MRRRSTFLRARAWALLCALALPLLLATGGPVAAQQQAPAQLQPDQFPLPIPGNSPATSKEQVQIYREEPGHIMGRVSIPDFKAGLLVQPEGRDWRSFRTFWLKVIAGAVILGMTGLLAIFFLWRGKIRIQHGWSGRTIPRFNGFERAAHWLTAVSFIVLALSGLVVTFGRPLLIPLLGHEAFTGLAQASKYAHNFFSVPFVLGVLLILVLWIRDNIPEKADVTWLKEGGGILKGGGVHPEAGRFNAGQKMIFWSVVLGGIALAVTGYALMAPFYVTDIGGMQVLHVAHALIGAVMITIIIAHIYIGTIGMEGAFDAMGSGQVDENWAREHHSRWYEEVTGRPGIPGHGAHHHGRPTASGTPAE